jgi:hypothetical protein
MIIEITNTAITTLRKNGGILALSNYSGSKIKWKEPIYMSLVSVIKDCPIERMDQPCEKPLRTPMPRQGLILLISTVNSLILFM